MAQKFYYIHKETNRKFEIIDVDPEAGTITLKGDLSVFTEVWDKERFKALGYKRHVEEVDDEEPVT
jgi:hypothetical protein